MLGAVCVETEPPLVEVDDGHLMRCHIPLEELRSMQTQAPA
jgi:peptide/nickel transport system ATP-binding protein